MLMREADSFRDELTRFLIASHTYLAAERATIEAWQGWKLVPVKPTPEMVEAGWRAAGSTTKALDCYRAMLAAAPDFKEPRPRDA